MRDGGWRFFLPPGEWRQPEEQADRPADFANGSPVLLLLRCAGSDSGDEEEAAAKGKGKGKGKKGEAEAAERSSKGGKGGKATGRESVLEQKVDSIWRELQEIKAQLRLPGSWHSEE